MSDTTQLFPEVQQEIKTKNEVKKDIHALKPPLVSDSKIRQIINFFKTIFSHLNPL